MYFSKFFAILLCILVISQCQGVSGCGGSVKASPAIMNVLGTVPNFSDITVSLVTSDGVIQEQAMCSPQGYFFLPVYDMGDYSVSVSKKEGWTVRPDQVQISMNEEGMILGCENKLDFEVTGFQIHGHTHNTHSEVATSGITITLSSLEGRLIQTTTTNENGSYTFQNVVSGTYLLSASHPSWVIAEPSQQTITVGFGSMKVETDFLVSGYKVNGMIENNSGYHAITGIAVRLVQEAGELFECGNNLVKECLVEVDTTGSFTFANVQEGYYHISPQLTSSLEWVIEPTDVRIHIQNNSVDLGTIFLISGFNLHGVVYDEDGKPIKDVCIGVDSQITESCTNEAGEYTLYDMKEGLYMIDAHHKSYHFSFIKIDSKPELIIPALSITHYIQCGNLETALLKNYPSITTQFTVQALQDGQVIKEYNTFEQFCFILLPGIYSFAVKPVEASSSIPSLSFTSLSQIELQHQYLPNDIVLSPIAQSIAGSVQMFTKDSMTVDLYYGNVLLGSTQTDKENQFLFKGILPGQYTLRISDAKGCWGSFEDGSLYEGSSAEIVVDVTTESVMNAHLIQTGYVISITSPVQASAELIEGHSSKTIDLQKGVTRLCVAHSLYRLIPHACFDCLKKEFVLSAEHASIELHPSTYAIDGNINAPAGTSIIVTVKKEDQIITETAAVYQDNQYHYHLMLDEGMYTFSYQAPSSALLFNPPSQQVKVLANQCQPILSIINTREGRIVSGQIIPPLPNVLIRMTIEENGEHSILETTSNDKGFYSFTAIDQTTQFISFFFFFLFEAIKEGHIFHTSPDGLNFSHQKLSSLRVYVHDENEHAVEGVLLSLSSTGYNANHITREDGSYVFGPLFPGDYFIQYQLKEYSFNPSSSTITIEEGVSMEMTIPCTRIAYSAYGRIHTITGQPISKQRILAVSTSGHRESGVTDNEGYYRIRGLQPGQEYALSLPGVSNSVPSTHIIKMTKEDQKEQDFLLLSTPTSATLYGVIESSSSIVPEDLIVTATGKKGKKTAKVTVGGSFELAALNDEEYTLSVSSSNHHQKLHCEKKTIEVDKAHLNEVALTCSVEFVNEVEVVKGGSYLLLALVVIGLFIFIEKERLRQAF